MTREQKLAEVLTQAREKLKLYRAVHSGEYLGGVEYSELMRRIDEALDFGHDLCYYKAQ